MRPTFLLASLAFAAPTYPDVEPVLRRKCCACHQRGLAAPMSLGSYEEVAPRAESIREAVGSGRMPPWHADPKHGRWANDRRLSAMERATLLGWIDAGCPRGERAGGRKGDPPPGWRIRPDVVLTMPEEEAIPAAGLIPYRFVKVPTGFTEDVWVRAAEVQPGNRRVVHHVLIFAPRDTSGIAIDNGLLASYLPGDDPLEMPAGYAKRIPAGTPLVFQLHYTPTGKPEKDRTSIGLVLAAEPPEYEVRTVNVEATGFVIPAGAADHRLDARRPFNERGELLSLTPHMHLRGKSFTCELVRPGAPAETLLSVPDYDFNWQTTYRLARPKAMPVGCRIDCTAHYDNSAANPANPDPTRDVRHGEMVTDEMMIGFVDFAVPRRDAIGHATPRRATGRAEWASPAIWVAVGTGLLGCALAARQLRRFRASRT
jgi:hypothetical protein